MSEIESTDNSKLIHIPELQKAAIPVFSNPGFRNIVWAGVFGSVSRDQQIETSDVDVVIVWHPGRHHGWDPPGDYFCQDLEKELEKCWTREVDVVEIQECGIARYIDAEALLCSRTLYGSGSNKHVVRARKNALEFLENGIRFFAYLADKMVETKMLVKGKSFEDFTASLELRQVLEDRLYTVLDTLEHLPYMDPLRSRFTMTIFYPALQLRQVLREEQSRDGSDNPNSSYWKAVWDAVCDPTPSVNNFRNFNSWIRVLVIEGGLKGTRRLGERVQKLAAEEDAKELALQRSQDKSWSLYLGRLVTRLIDRLTRGAARMY